MPKDYINSVLPFDRKPALTTRCYINTPQFSDFMRRFPFNEVCV